MSEPVLDRLNRSRCNMKPAYRKGMPLSLADAVFGTYRITSPAGQDANGTPLYPEDIVRHLQWGHLYVITRQDRVQGPKAPKISAIQMTYAGRDYDHVLAPQDIVLEVYGPNGPDEENGGVVEP